MLIVPEEPDGETLRVPVLRVFDGDGFLTHITVPHRNVEMEATVRFGFIDAPEMDQPGGHEAREFLSSLISDQWLDLTILMKMDTGGIVDRHGRIVAVPYLRLQSPDDDDLAPSIMQRLFGAFARGTVISRNIELEMVLNGWAWVLDRYDPDERYFEALEDAQRNRRGIWALDDNVHPWEFKKQRYRAKRQPQRKLIPEPSLFSAAGNSAHCPKESCGGHMVARQGRFGTFYGCSNFPKCRYSCSTLG
jgi:endonuclease YncB( thermonuclease family)